MSTLESLSHTPTSSHPRTRFLPYIALGILAAAAAQPLANAWLPCTDDAPFHLYRAVELGSLMALGHWFPRWAPHMALGYGYPFYDFYAPLSSYGVVLLHVIGLAYPAALKLAFALGLWLAGVGAFLLTREIARDVPPDTGPTRPAPGASAGAERIGDMSPGATRRGDWSPEATRRGEAAGLAAGAAYLFAPYLAYDVLFRGNLAESAAFIWPPLVLWGLIQLRKDAAQQQRSLASRGGSFPARHFAAGSSFTPAHRSPALPAARGQTTDDAGAWVLHTSSLVILPYAALILTHNIFALIASPLFAGYAALLAWQARSWRVLARGLFALALGIALTTYFWAPALAERNLVHSDRLFVPPIFTWYTNFISPGELLAAPHAEDPSLVNPSPARAVGLLPVLLGLPALVVALYQTLRVSGAQKTLKVLKTLRVSHEQQTLKVSETFRVYSSSTLFFAAGLAGYGLLTLPVSAPIWRLITPMALVQFPWRMLGPAALCAAVLIGLSVAEAARWLASKSSRARSARWFAAAPLVLAVGAIYFGNLSWWYPRYCASSPTANVADMVKFEIDSHTVGTTAKGEYIPVTASGVPADTGLAQAIESGGEPSRLSLPDSAVVTLADTHDPLDARYEITASQPVTATYRQFDYPGWSVTIDGRLTPAAPDEQTGLIVFALPAGVHAVRVTFGSTPLRSGAVALSLITLAALLVYGVSIWTGVLPPTGVLRDHPRPLYRWGRGADTSSALSTHEPGHPSPVDQSTDSPIDQLTNQPIDQSTSQPINPLPLTTYPLLVFFALLPILKLGVIDRTQNPLRHTAARLGQQPMPLDFAGGMHLFGYDFAPGPMPADGAFDIALYVGQTTTSERRYWPSFDVVDDAGLTWQDPAYLPPRWQREPPGSPLWPLDEYAQWARHLSLLPGTPPGTYTLYGTIFDLDSQQIASVLDAAGNAVAPRFALGQLTVGRPARPFALAPPKPAFHDFGPIALLGYDLDRAAANAGDTLRLSLFWRGQLATRLNDPADLSFTGADGKLAYRVAGPPVNGLPTSAWQPGDEWRGQSRVRLPADLPAGDYTLAVALNGAAPGSAPLGVVRVSAPTRSFQRPPVAVLSGAAFSGVAVLEGYDLTRAAGSLTINLVWRATATPDAGYSAFVHLQGADGRVWAQNDAAPANWTRPTTGWLPGEYLSDAHTLGLPGDLPPGTYTLWVGLYDPRTGVRVPAAGAGAAADQRVAIGQVIFP